MKANDIKLADKLGNRMKADAKNSIPHLMILAYAGTGKTTTIVEGLKYMRGETPLIRPSDQQKVIWEEMARGRDTAKSICFVAFNKSIATELQRRVPKGVDAMTMHSMGYKAVQSALGRQAPVSWRVENIIADLLGSDPRQLRRDKPGVVAATRQLVSLCKMNLIGDGIESEEGWIEEISTLASYYDIDLADSRELVFELVPQVLEKCKDPRGEIDFDDMVWLPVVLNLPMMRYDMLLTDESQDLNKCQQALSKRAGKRLVFVGDPHQAIYGFAGADAESMSRLQQELGDTQEGLTILPLTVTRRCGRAIVKEAQKYVPDFEAHESNCDGIVSEARYILSGPKGDKSDVPFAKSYMAGVQDGDFILCRCNAPLVSNCFRFLKLGRKATIQGRDIGQGLISLIDRMKATSLLDLVAKITDWQAKETAKEEAKRNPSESKLLAISDKASCLICFTEDATDVDAVKRKIESIFTDDKNCPGIKLSSVHKAKGLEADRVFLLVPEEAPMPHPLAKSNWERQQELNILYVAITRAIKHLVYVS